MEIFFSHVISGVQLGILYAIVTIGFNILILVTGILNFGYTNLLVLSMYMAWLILGATNNNLVLGIMGAIFSGIVINAVLAPVFMPFIKRKAHLEALVISIGIALIAGEIMSHWLNRGLPVAFPPVMQMSGTTLRFGMASVGMGKLLSLFVGIIMVYTFFRFLYRTKKGMILRAVAQDSEIAEFLGISIPKMSVFSFALSGLLAGVVAVLLAMSLGSAAPDLGDNITLMCLAILFLAGIGNLKGGLICALLVGVVEGLVMGYLPGDWTKALAFSVILAVLMFKPEGIFGTQH